MTKNQYFSKMREFGNNKSLLNAVRIFAQFSSDNFRQLLTNSTNEGYNLLYDMNYTRVTISLYHKLSSGITIGHTRRLLGSTSMSEFTYKPPNKVEELFAATDGNKWAKINAPTAGAREERGECFS